MSIYKLNATVAYDQGQGVFMFYLDDGLKMLPQHFVSRIEAGESKVEIHCEGKHHKEAFEFPADNADELAEQLNLILEEF